MRFASPVRVVNMTSGDKPGYSKKHYRAVAKSFSFDKRKFKYENFDGYGSTRVVVHEGYSLDVWDYYTRHGAQARRTELRLNAAIAIGAFGLCIVDALLHEE